MTDVIVISIVLIIVGLISLYIYKEKKKGVKCIGCPSACTCGENKSACGGCKGSI